MDMADNESRRGKGKGSMFGRAVKFLSPSHSGSSKQSQGQESPDNSGYHTFMSPPASARKMTHVAEGSNAQVSHGGKCKKTTHKSIPLPSWMRIKRAPVPIKEGDPVEDEDDEDPEEDAEEDPQEYEVDEEVSPWGERESRSPYSNIVLDDEDPEKKQEVAEDPVNLTHSPDESVPMDVEPGEYELWKRREKKKKEEVTKAREGQSKANEDVPLRDPYVDYANLRRREEAELAEARRRSHFEFYSRLPSSYAPPMYNPPAPFYPPSPMYAPAPVYVPPPYYQSPPMGYYPPHPYPSFSPPTGYNPYSVYPTPSPYPPYYPSLGGVHLMQDRRVSVAMRIHLPDGHLIILSSLRRGRRNLGRVLTNGRRCGRNLWDDGSVGRCLCGQVG